MNKHFYTIAVGSALMGLAVASWSMENPPMGGPGNMLEQADTNHDGKVSYDEFKAFHEKRMQEHFKKMDLNGDGYIDKEEAAKAREMMHEKRQERMEKRQEMHNKMQDGKSQ